MSTIVGFSITCEELTLTETQEVAAVGADRQVIRE